MVFPKRLPNEKGLNLDLTEEELEKAMLEDPEEETEND